MEWYFLKILSSKPLPAINDSFDAFELLGLERSEGQVNLTSEKRFDITALLVSSVLV